MARITQPHPSLPFIELHIDRPSAEELAEWGQLIASSEDYIDGPDLHASATIDREVLVDSYLASEADHPTNETLFAEIAQYAETSLFEETGPWKHLGWLIAKAVEAGDFATLALLAQGFGYWQGVNEAHARASSLLNDAAPGRPRTYQNRPFPLSLFDRGRRFAFDIRTQSEST